MTASIADLEREEAILEFALFKDMAYAKRIKVSMALAAVGVLVQVVTLNAFAGIPFLLAAVLLSWVKGYDNRVDRRRYQGGASWEPVRFSRLEEILALDKKMVSWDQSLIDLSSGSGCAFAVVVLMFGGLITVGLWQWSSDIALVFAVDAALLVLFQWVNGMRSIQRRPNLLFKVRHLIDTARVLRDGVQGGGELSGQLLMQSTGGDSDGFPVGAKIAITWPDGPADFYGVQGQVVVNDVQGSKHPYFYAVLVGRQGKGLLDAGRTIELPDEVILEAQNKNEVDVLIIRQYTTKTSGYKTSVARSREILRTAVNAAAAYVAAS